MHMTFTLVWLRGFVPSLLLLPDCNVLLMQAGWHRVKVLHKQAGILETPRLDANPVTSLMSIKFSRHEAECAESKARPWSLLSPEASWWWFQCQLKVPQEISRTSLRPDAQLLKDRI